MFLPWFLNTSVCVFGFLFIGWCACCNGINFGLIVCWHLCLLVVLLLICLCVVCVLFVFIDWCGSYSD